MWERHTQKAGELWITDLLQSVKRCRSTACPTEPAALLQSVGSRSRPVNISANQKWSFYDTLLWHIPPCEIWHDDCLHMRIYLWMTFHMLTISHSMTFLQNHSVAGEIMSHDPASTSMPKQWWLEKEASAADCQHVALWFMRLCCAAICLTIAVAANHDEVRESAFL